MSEYKIITPTNLGARLNLGEMYKEAADQSVGSDVVSASSDLRKIFPASEKKTSFKEAYDANEQAIATLEGK